MQSVTQGTPRVQVRFLPLALGIFFAAVTARVIFDDVWQGAEITTNHILSVAALVAAIASGNVLASAARDREWFTAAALAVIFFAATTFVVVSAGSRNAGTVETAQKANHFAADERSRLVNLRGAAERRLATCPAGTAKGDAGVTCGLLDAVAAECATGGGTRCDGRRATVAVQQALVAAYAARLDVAAPTRAKGIDYAHAARVIAALPFVTANANAIEDRLTLLLPFALALIVEIGTITYLHRAFSVAPARMSPGPRQDDPGKTPAEPRQTTPARPRQDPEFGAFGFLPTDPGKTPANNPGNGSPAVVPTTYGKNGEEHPVIVALKGRGGRVASCTELAAAMGVSARAALRLRREVEDRISVVDMGPGKSNEIRLR